MKTLSGLGKKDRKRLAEIIRETKSTISVSDVSEILMINPGEAAKMLSRWTTKGWLSRVQRGYYIRVPLESQTPDIPLDDPWVIAARLFPPCYIGGWTAAGYWDLTEQIFRTIVIMTTQKPRKRALTIKGTHFMLRTIAERAFFGMEKIWRGQEKISISDPSRTILDVLASPKLGGGIRPASDMLMNYLKSEKKNLDLLIEYAERLNNGAVFKRLGFLLERFSPAQKGTIEMCAARLTKGTVKLDPSLKADRLITRWRIWVPDGWRKEV